MTRLEDVLRRKYEEAGSVASGPVFAEDLGYWTGYADEDPDEWWLSSEWGKSYRRGYQEGLLEAREA